MFKGNFKVADTYHGLRCIISELSRLPEPEHFQKMYRNLSCHFAFIFRNFYNAELLVKNLQNLLPVMQELTLLVRERWLSQADLDICVILAEANPELDLNLHPDYWEVYPK